MRITLDELRALEAVAEHGSLAKASRVLKKAHTAILYSLKNLEAQTEIKLLDRSQYRTTLTQAGGRFLEEAKKVLASERVLQNLCNELKVGWEPTIRIVVDGIVPIEPVVRTLGQLKKKGVPTRIELCAEFLGGVEQTFEQSNADIMISVLPPEHLRLDNIELPSIEAYLVAHLSHPLGQKRKTFTLEEMKGHAFLTVRGSDPRLVLSTSRLDPESTFQLNDFHSKKAALLNGLGFGWMPKYLIESELKLGRLIKVNWVKSSRHYFEPRLYHRGSQNLGRAAGSFVKMISENF